MKIPRYLTVLYFAALAAVFVLLMAAMDFELFANLVNWLTGNTCVAP